MEHLTRFDVFIACFGALTPLIAIFLALHMQNRSDKKKSDGRLDFLLREYPLHGHAELTPFAKPTDTLTVEGVRFPQRNGNGK